MNLPNKLTVLRMAMIPFFVAAYMIEGIPYGRIIALVLFIVASFTDTLDGYIARKYNLVTNFGKFMDPLADKLLVCSAMIAMVELNKIQSWVVIVIIGREFIISGFRLVASDNGKVIAASWWGKIKTVVQMIMIIYILFEFTFSYNFIVTQILIYSSLVLTLVSLVDYLIKNKSVLADFK